MLLIALALQMTTTVENGVWVHRNSNPSIHKIAADDNVHKVEVKRLDKDLYQIVGTKLVIKTRYCYVYTYGEPVILDADERKIIFINQSQSCDVTGVY